MDRILDKITCVTDIKNLSVHEMEKLAGEIREYLIDTVSKTGGHLGPSLGVVELTLVLHQIFDSPHDKIIWDVGHQCYTHKIITGRKDNLSTLRQFQGISGFPKTKESEHDCFNTGHSSTSISAAVGMAKARDLKGEDSQIIAVIGDGALTGGMAFEALNHAGDLQTDLIVVLNDNEMSISPNVGAVSGYLSRIRTSPQYSKSKDEIENLLAKIPKYGHKVVKMAERFKDSLKYFFVPGILFEEMGFTYLGPIDGHNIEAIQSVMQTAKTLKGPVLIHVITQKGRGYRPAEENPDKFHGIGPFDKETGAVIKPAGPPTYTKVFGDALTSLAKNHKNIVAVTAAMCSGTGLLDFAHKFPQRFFDVGIAEQHAVTFSAGMATQGFHPVVAVYSSFLQRAYDQVLHDVCLQKLPVTIALDRAGLVGEDGETHQGIYDISYLRHIPNLVMMAPKDEQELRHMIYTSIMYDGPSVVRYPRGEGMGVSLTGGFLKLPIGYGEIVREGQDVMLVGVGPMVYLLLEVAQALEKMGISAMVINPRFIKPLDAELILGCAKRIGRMVTLEEHTVKGGFGSACLELLNEAGSPAEIEIIGLPDSFIEQGAVATLREHYGISLPKIIERITARWDFSGQKKVNS